MWEWVLASKDGFRVVLLMSYFCCWKMPLFGSVCMLVLLVCCSVSNGSAGLNRIAEKKREHPRTTVEVCIGVNILHCTYLCNASK